MKVVTKVLLTLAIGMMLLGAFGCNTVRGMGRDVEAAGDSVQDAVGR